MNKGHGYFNYMEDIMKYHCHWYDQPDTLRGKLMKVYNVFRIALCLLLLIVASSQVYYYGISYVVHSSAVFVPLGIMGVVLNSYLACNFGPIMKTATQFDLFLNSFLVDWEREFIENRIKEAKLMVTRIMNVIKFYVYITAVTHCTSISIYYFFGLFSKPIILPLLFEKFMEGNFELRPLLFVIVIVSVLYVNLVSSLITEIGLIVHFLGSVAGTLEVLIRRIENLSERTGKKCEKLNDDSDLSDTIQKHADLLMIVNDMVNWNGFPIAFTITACSILFCINGVTAMRSLENREYLSFCIWGTFLLVCMWLTYIICSGGQEIEMKSEELLRGFYNLPWYQESSKSRRTVAMMLVQGNRLITLDYKGLLRLNMLTFSEMMKKSYSYFMLLTSTE